ncbi:MAG: monovalent cation/H+ antiporter complex subunit F [Alkalispirochaetaceae bacterium]
MGIINFLQYAMIGAILISMVRVVVGPTLVDRMIGLNVVAALVLALLVLIAVEERATFYLDVALVYDIFGFIGILAITRYFSRRREGM